MDNEVGIIILAGGLSSRMGTDKGLMLVNKQPVISYLLKTVQQITKNILLISDHKGYQEFGYAVVEDRIKNIGPIGGLLSGLEASNTEWNIVLSCDVPLVSEKLLKALIDLKLNGKLLAVAKHHDRTHPLIGIYSKQLLPAIQSLINQKKYRMSGLYNNKSALIVDFSHFPAKEFLNLNTPTELDTFKQILNDN